MLDELIRTGNMPILASVTADVVDTVRWLDQQTEQLKGLKIQDVQNQKPWIEELLEDFVTFDVAPGVRPDEARTILTELRKEISAKQNAGFGADARNYLFKLERELEILIEKL